MQNNPLKPLKPKSILIVEDDVSAARSFAFSIGSVSSLDLVATVHTAEEAIRFLKAQPVDICLVDIGKHGKTALDVVRVATGLPTPIQVLVVSVFGDEKNIVAAIEAGASGYVLRDEITHSVESEITTLLTTGSALSPKVAMLLLKKIRSSQRSTDPTHLRKGAAVKLSPRESDVLKQIARGHSYAEISEALGITIQTVSVHLRNVYRKLDVHSRSEAVYKAGQMGLLRSKSVGREAT